jgi:hypothetical protein
MTYYDTKTFKLRNDEGDFDYFCAYCGERAERDIESHNSRDSTYHYSCGACLDGRTEKNFIDKILHHSNEISKIRMKIGTLHVNEAMIKGREYENKLRRLNKEYFGEGK